LSSEKAAGAGDAGKFWGHNGGLCLEKARKIQTFEMS
jgi:hypothetical protein